jgi:hypothetical protein
MRLSWIRGSLIILVLSAQADDIWAAPTVWPAPPVADDDEYLPSEQHRTREQFEVRQAFGSTQTGATSADFSSNPIASRYLIKVTDYLASGTLYVFMSLQR